MVSPGDLEGVKALAGVDARARASAAGVDARASAGADAVDATVSAGAGLLGLGVVRSASACLGIGECRNHGILGGLLPTSCALSCATCPGECSGAEAIAMSHAGPPGE